jgi:hypothetical protein
MFRIISRGIWFLEQTPASEQIREELAHRRKHQYLLFVATIALMVCAMFLRFDKPVTDTILILLIVGSTILHNLTWKCPSCEKFLGKGLYPSACRKCGVQFK